jgi:hypothetical protein
MERELVKGKWNQRRLMDVIRQRYGKRSHAGRRPRQPIDEHDAALQVLRLAEQFVRVVQHLGVGAGDDTLRPPVKLPVKLVAALRESVKPMRRVIAAATYPPKPVISSSVTVRP